MPDEFDFPIAGWTLLIFDSINEQKLFIENDKNGINVDLHGLILIFKSPM